ncbi:hypothetical protein PFISCL1PPCAC_7988, partial [Pristionchus fissidentatus]
VNKTYLTFLEVYNAKVDELVMRNKPSRYRFLYDDSKKECGECKEKFDTNDMRACLERNCTMYRKLVCFTCCVDGHSQHKKSKNGRECTIGKLGRIDHSKFPDRRVLVAEGKEIIVSGTMLAMRSPYFLYLFYRNPARMKIDRFELPFDPIDLSILLDHVYYPFMKDVYPCECTDCLERLSSVEMLAKLLKISVNLNKRFKTPTMTKKSYRTTAVSIEFPDARIVRVGDATFVVSTTILSLFNKFFEEFFHSNPIDNENEFVFDRCDEVTFQEMLDLVEGRNPKYLSLNLCQLMEDLKADRYSLFDIITVIDNRFNKNSRRDITIPSIHLMYSDLPLMMRDAVTMWWSAHMNHYTSGDKMKRCLSLLKKADIDWLIEEGLEKADIIRYVNRCRKAEDQSTIERREGLKRREEREECSLSGVQSIVHLEV